jgi:hypothetical protein
MAKTIKTFSPHNRPAPKNMAPAKASPKAIEAIREKLRAARDLKIEIRDIEERAKARKADLYKIERAELPEMFSRAGIDNLGLPPEGNMPGYDAQLKPYYSANIAAAWEDDKKAIAYNYLKDEKAEDLIKATITIRLKMGSTKIRKAVMAALKKLKVEYEMNLSVHSASLTSWLKSRVEDGKPPKLDLIGAEVGQVVKIDPRTED